MDVKCWTVFLLLLNALPSCFGSSFQTVCYFTNWSNKLANSVAKFEISNINTTLCTHLIYAFVNINPATFNLEKSQADDDDGSGSGRFYEFNRLKQQAKGLVTLISVGGAINNNEVFEAVIKSTTSRETFSKNVATFLRQKGFDGIDLDWEWPGRGNKDNFTLLLKTIHEEFQREASDSNFSPLLLTVAVAVGQETIAASYNIPEMSKFVDYIHVMTYDFHGSWSRLTSFTAPLYSRASNIQFNQQLSQAWALNYWIQSGAPANKLILGTIGTATTFKLSNSSFSDVGAPVSGPGNAGPYLQISGRVVSYRVCEMLKNGAVEKWDNEQKVAYFYANGVWVGYDNQRSFAEKVRFAHSLKLAGMMFWSLEQDDFRGTFCGTKYPLLTAIFDTIQELTATTTTTTTTTTTSSPHCTNTTLTCTAAKPVVSLISMIMILIICMLLY